MRTVAAARDSLAAGVGAGLARIEEAGRGGPEVVEANRIARLSYHVAVAAASRYGALVMLDNPWSSYRWAYLDRVTSEHGEFLDVKVSLC